MRELLATIGRSSKRDEIGFARTEFLGQFGIGLLSAFMVSDEIEVLTQPADGPTTRWVGTADGRYSITEAEPREAAGTTVTLRPVVVPSSGSSRPRSIELIKLFGALLPLEIRVDGEQVTDGKAPWESTGAPSGPSSSATRRTSSASPRST